MQSLWGRWQRDRALQKVDVAPFERDQLGYPQPAPERELEQVLCLLVAFGRRLQDRLALGLVEWVVLVFLLLRGAGHHFLEGDPLQRVLVEQTVLHRVVEH